MAGVAIEKFTVTAPVVGAVLRVPFQTSTERRGRISRWSSTQS